MELRPARAAYAALLHLHPLSFRSRFADDMLAIFDEAAEDYGTTWLLAEAAASAVRQQLLRDTEDDPPIVCAGLIAGTYPASRSPHLTPAKLFAAALASVLLIGLIRPFPF